MRKGRAESLEIGAVCTTETQTETNHFPMLSFDPLLCNLRGIKVLKTELRIIFELF